nr:MAG TPA: hypothetical protein [Crassvirales sp.]DAI05267.1 MAG TPA: hypothetical protein [Crassvirales sp.]DAR56537.1 MAG TPA: hypothetical protein [Crassvirales sp.]
MYYKSEYCICGFQYSRIDISIYYTVVRIINTGR